MRYVKVFLSTLQTGDWDVIRRVYETDDRTHTDLGHFVAEINREFERDELTLGHRADISSRNSMFRRHIKLDHRN